MSTTTRRIKRALDHTVDEAGDAAAHAVHRAGRAARQLADRVGEGADQARERLHDAADATALQVRRARRHATHVARRHPWWTVGLGVAVLAVVAAAALRASARPR